MSWQQQHSARRTIFTSTLDFNLRKKLVKCYVWSITLCGVETWTLRKANHKYLESSDVGCWRGKDMIIWTDRMKNEILQHVKKKRNIINSTKQRKAILVGHILRRNYFPKHVIKDKKDGKTRKKS